MSFNKHIIHAGRDEACRDFLARQENYVKTSKAIMYFAFFGGLVILVTVSDIYGPTVSSLCAIVGTVWYVLGYFYCQVLWNKEKDATEFHKALNENKE